MDTSSAGNPDIGYIEIQHGSDYANAINELNLRSTYGKPLWAEEYWYELSNITALGTQATHENFVKALCYPTFGSWMREHVTPDAGGPTYAANAGKTLFRWLMEHDEGLRRMGDFARFFRHADTLGFQPAGSLVDRGYCGRFGEGFALYVPGGGSVTLNLSGAPGSYEVEHMDIHSGAVTRAGQVEGGAPRLLSSGTGSDYAWLLRKAATIPLIPAGSMWHYRDTGADPGTSWRAPAFDDSTWSTGPAELGYGDAPDGRPEVTQVNFGTDPNNKPITVYFRHAFSFRHTPVTTALDLRLLRDDGAVVYLNGIEILRSNMPEGSITSATPALVAVGGVDEAAFKISRLPADLLVSGVNVLAVEIHQATPNSSDLSFDLELSAVLREAPPLLEISRLHSQVLLTWPQTTPPYLLHSTSNLVAAPWEPVVIPPIAASAQFQVRLPFGSNSRFFRLLPP